MRRITLLTILILLTYVGVSQKNADIGFIVGGATYLGDVNTENPFRTIKPGVQGFYRHNIHSRLAVRGNATYARIGGRDNLSDFDYQNLRGIEFDADLFEIAGMLEFNFFRFEQLPRQRFISPYINGGIGLMTVDFQFNSNFREYFTIPFGVGVKIGINERWAVGLEYSFHRTFRDDLDKIPDWLYTSSETYPLKQRANVQNDDWFTFFGVFLSYNLKDCVTCPANL
ncbi:MAG: DUF6089 family protein [Salinivirgaceae bacterium]|jgi:hypothetical protein|nr:DUF6089 family protein [Salinivirgaceae bacterium]